MRLARRVLLKQLVRLARSIGIAAKTRSEIRSEFLELWEDHATKVRNLVERTNLKAGSFGDGALIRLEARQQHLQQGCFPRAVAPN